MDARKDQHRQKALTQQELAVSNEGGSMLGQIVVEVVENKVEAKEEGDGEERLDPALTRYYKSLENGGQEAGMVVEEGSDESSEEEEFTTVE